MERSKSETLDIDARFLLANERTLPAWIHTSIAVEAGSVALIQTQRHHSYLSVTVLLFGGLVALIGYRRFRVANQAIRSQELPPEGIGPALTGWVRGIYFSCSSYRRILFPALGLSPALTHVVV